MKNSINRFEVFEVFHNRESFFKDRSLGESYSLVLKQLLVVCVFALIYGAIMGSYHSFYQSIASGIKLVILFFGAMLICFPSLFVIQKVLGSKMNLVRMLIVLLSGMVLSSTLVVALSPIVIFFQFTGGNYHFIQLLHVAIFLFSGFFGMRLIIDALKLACEKDNVYPQIGVTVFKIWIIILAFVGIQLAWNLRPFLSQKEESFKLFRSYEGNFYTAVIYSFKQLNNPNQTGSEEVKAVYNYVDTAKVCKDSIDIKQLMDE